MKTLKFKIFVSNKIKDNNSLFVWVKWLFDKNYIRNKNEEFPMVFSNENAMEQIQKFIEKYNVKNFSISKNVWIA